MRGAAKPVGPASGLLLACLAAGAGVRRGPAEVVLDGKFGSNSALAGPNYSIPAEAGLTRGNNLFHSFSQFNLSQGEVAAFSGPANIQNILARVTGGSPSSIDGTIRSEIAGANLFLLNPKGIVFGPNAALDVSGSFAASSADYLKLQDNARFVASIDADDSVLTSAPVAAFGFLGSSAGSISVEQSTLSVPEGKKLSLAGGPVSLNGGSLQAPGGEINVVSASTATEVLADSPAPLSAGGAIDLAARAHIDSSGQGGGRIVIRGGRLTVDSSRIEANTLGAGEGKEIDIQVADDLRLSNGGQINSLSTSEGSGGDIRIASGSLHLDGGGLTDDFFNPATQISAATGDLFFGGGPGRGGNISIHTGELELVNSAQISSASFGAGDAGRIDIDAKSVLIDALQFTFTQITANTQQIEGGGKAGDISIRTDSFTLQNGATILAATFGSGPAGSVEMNAREINLLSGGIITAGTFGAGPGGNVQITAEHLQIDGKDALGGGPDLLTGIQAVTTSSESPAPAGTIRTQTDRLDLRHNGSIFTSSIGQGPGGAIDIHSGRLTLDNASSIRATGDETGPAGNIAIETTGPVLLANQSSIATSAPGSSGGNIQVRAGEAIRLSDSEISAQAGLNGGNIEIASPSLLYVKDSTITGQADTTGSGFGNGGNLTLSPSLLILKQGQLISKSSFGNGGNINLLSDVFFPSESIIDASAPFGIPGTVQVTAPEVDLSGVLAALASNLIDASTLLRPECGIRLGGNISSFIVMGRGGLPIAPGGFIPSGVTQDQHEAK